jgi:2-polyprenyl-3-methyl-5-hydroxy-6-metoxy-1,4-benzoquinol methylase
MVTTSQAFVPAKPIAEKVSQPQCVACGSFSTRTFWLDKKRAIYECAKCGLLFRFPMPNADDLHNEFQVDYFKGSAGKNQSRLTSEFETWRRPVLARISQIIHGVKSGGKLLDVGCASGELFAYLGNEWDVCGIEPSRVAVERARQRFGQNPNIEIQEGYVSDIPAEASWDVVTVLESLFYMPDPRRELNHISQLLKDDGRLIIATPSYQYQRLRHTGLISRLLYGTRCSLTASHLYYFPRRALAGILQDAGFIITRVVPLGSSSYGGAAARAAHRAYVGASRVLNFLTVGRINLAPHVLYVCAKNRT